MKRIISVAISAILIISVLFATTITTNAVTASSTAGTVAISSGSLNVRSNASSSSLVIFSLYKGSYITLISKNGSWWYVEYAKGKYGYSHADYIKTVSSKTATLNTQSGNLNVRSTASIYGTKTGTLPKGEVVIVLSTYGQWSYILYNGIKTGYVSSQYLSVISSNITSSYKAVTLSVPSFKQTDTRWASVKIGSSGKTIAQIGCATTAIAMMESYRTGTTIYPDAMSKRLSYSSTGSVYWPSNYTVITSSSGYLKSVYDKLIQGKPVLFGAKNSYGSQHWVVITGYKGGSTLSASSFLINDPGSNSRTTLQEFLNSYPTFYKYFYY